MKKTVHTPHRPFSDPKKQTFTDEEILTLEQSFIDSYLTGSTKPLSILLKLYRHFRKDLFLSLLFLLIKHSPVIVLPIVTANIINLITDPTDNAPLLIAINLIVMLVLFLQNILTTTLYIRYRSKVSRRMEAALRGAMVRKLQQLSITFHKEMQSGRIQSKLMRDVETIQVLSDTLFSTIPLLIIEGIFMIVVVLLKSPVIFLFFLLCIPFAVLLIRVFRKDISKRNEELRRDTEKASAGLMDMVEMTQITRAHALEQREINRMTHLLNRIANTGIRLDVIQALFGSTSWVMFSLFQLMCLAFCAWLAFSDHIQVGDITLYQSYFTSLTGSISSVVNMLPNITKGIESIKSVGEILQNPNIEENENKLEVEFVSGEYEFRNVQFSYEEDQPLLRGLSLHVRPGETIAFVGESGSGKTTLLNLIIGFNKPKAGQLLIDGMDMEDIDLRSYRKHIAIVPQNSVLFTGTIRENITYGLENRTEEDIHRALEAARLTEFVEKLPQGIDTMLAEHGANLSGGQRQRLSIARAILRDPDVIILDEATSALDSISEREIQHAINNMAKGRTTFIVAHRLSTIRNADRIAVIKEGICAEIGTYEELMERRGEFWRMQTAQ